MRGVPFTSIFYMPKPFAVVLSRRRTQFFFTIMGFWTVFMASKEKKSWHGQHFRFSIIEQRQGQLEAQICAGNIQFTKISQLPCTNHSILRIGAGNMQFNKISHLLHSNHSCRDSETADIFSIGLLLDGDEIPVSCSVQHVSRSVFLSFATQIEYNGWYFVTSKSKSPSHDPVSFSLHSSDGVSWKVVGSSSYVRIHATTVFFHAHYRTSTARGKREVFDLYRLRVGSIWQSILTSFSLGLAGALKREDLGTPILCLFYGSWVVVHLIRAAHYLHAAQPTGCGLYLLLCTMQLGNLLLLLSEKWRLMPQWHGCLSVAVALLLCPFDYSGGVSAMTFYLPPGAVYLILGGIIEHHRLRTACWSYSLVAADRREYDMLWSRVAAQSAAEVTQLRHAALRIVPHRRLVPSPSWRRLLASNPFLTEGMDQRSMAATGAAAAQKQGQAVVRQGIAELRWARSGGMRGLVQGLNRLYEQVRTVCCLLAWVLPLHARGLHPWGLSDPHPCQRSFGGWHWRRAAVPVAVSCSLGGHGQHTIAARECTE
jgi:hypothetical protein